MKAFIACLGTETNTFSPIPTGQQNFAETMLFHGDATKHEANLFSEPMHVWRKCAESRNWDVAESIAAFAQPAGPTVRPVYEALRDELLDDLKKAMPVDMVLLCMHGAMVAEGYLDCEGDILESVRQVVGPEAAVGCELDLHCSITEKMTDSADVIITFKEYPHIDGKERAEELFNVLLAKVVGDAHPVISTYDTRMINMWRTPVEPMTGFVKRMQALEGKDGVLSVSFAHGFPWGDVPDASAKVVVVTDGKAEAGAALAETLGREIWDMRFETAPTSATIDEALDRAQAAETGPVVLADVSDNAGGGAPSDSTHILRAILDRGMTNVLSGLYWDPIAVRMCQEAGEGSTFELRIGGKCGRASGDPVDLVVTVKRIVEGAQQTFGTSKNAMGDAVWVQADGVDLVLNTVRTQTFHPDAFTQLGIDPAGYDVVVVKSTQHFYAGFAPFAAEVIYVAAPGAIPPDFASIPFEKFTDAYWPRVDNPY
jgi:microcystin degradation protein MlrC